ncbi:hypothetical protein DPEC_G00026180 [Dallia pectoralis]|uniref:Uncharacterized protein n=1 Tax=Dallia pectoralis TaxID=75939 RepID=A0ACC2HHE7_DALPE|nr:hypothetical protein DPEC_G00026180 [Dallia pectoralis]
MDQVKEQRPFCSLSQSQRGRERDRETDLERHYTAPSTEREVPCRVPTQKSYNSSETLQAYDHDPARLLFSCRVQETAHPDPSDYCRPGQAFSLRHLGICEPSTRRGLAISSETGLSHPLSNYSRGTVPSENNEPASPERTMAIWGRGAKSDQNFCLSSRSNSALTLTDTEMDNKSDNEIGLIVNINVRIGTCPATTGG